MLIECTLKRKEPIIVPIGNDTYEFKPDSQGRRIAEVWDERHIECFLSVPHLYREVKDGPDGSAAKVKDLQPRAAGHAAETMSRKDVIAALKAAGVTFNVTARTEDLIALLAQQAE